MPIEKYSELVNNPDADELLDPEGVIVKYLCDCAWKQGFMEGLEDMVVDIERKQNEEYS